LATLKHLVSKTTACCYNRATVSDLPSTEAGQYHCALFLYLCNQGDLQKLNAENKNFIPRGLFFVVKLAGKQFRFKVLKA